MNKMSLEEKSTINGGFPKFGHELQCFKAAKYEIQNTSTCHATLLLCLFLVNGSRFSPFVSRISSLLVKIEPISTDPGVSGPFQKCPSGAVYRGLASPGANLAASDLFKM